MFFMGANDVVDRAINLVEKLGKETVEVVVDLVAGGGISNLLDILKKGGRYATAGAIAAPLLNWTCVHFT